MFKRLHIVKVFKQKSLAASGATRTQSTTLNLIAVTQMPGSKTLALAERFRTKSLPTLSLFAKDLCPCMSLISLSLIFNQINLLILSSPAVFYNITRLVKSKHLRLHAAKSLGQVFVC